ncbi:thiamine biosynthesis protein ThiH [Tenacibaculum holothuriorum]|uniref:Thiamine biosynthesis protein ThiH n=1 Tax=Tenacibaculum holothuriorum TaxID=1635173 RepID=A0A1Y2P8S4_9FLAO|nr:2-iminoacetate synthase ThiH [Tenacibaculum holothuriorum]OSY86842.1 thiamine biosynthesis protein ThiH [Tenacibaculum holothuriorum]
MNKTFQDIFDTYNWDDTLVSILSKTENDVLNALRSNKRTLEDFKALISPAARPYLEDMAQLSRQLTKKRFGNTIQMYSPMYLSNECLNICTYCGFSLTNKIPRRTLTDAEILKEVEYIKSKGYDHILLVTGEANRTVGVDYISNAINLIRKHFSNITIEVQPLDQEEYELLIDNGLYAVLVYQETYHRDEYKKHHPKGRKSNFDYRLDTPDRLGKAGIHKIGLGALFGLEDWRADSFFTALHLKYLQKNYWKTKYSISFPRLRPHSGGLEPKVEMTDPDLVQLICAFRLLDEDVELSISTRESEIFRNNIVNLGITSISAESKTNPGGYAVEPQSLEQFEISDERSTEEVAEMLKGQGLEVVWKDWEHFQQ